jgi:peptide/nickel transport system substrate-binding protein
MQLRAWQDGPYNPWGAWMQPFAYRTSLTGMPNGFPLFHNIRKT